MLNKHFIDLEFEINSYFRIVIHVGFIDDVYCICDKYISSQHDSSLRRVLLIRVSGKNPERNNSTGKCQMQIHRVLRT